eukprot:jgi/Psemu1/16481/gm1.16481_g
MGKFRVSLRNVQGKTGGDDTTRHLYGRNMVNYNTIKKFMIMYREMLVWYMENVQYPPAPDNMSKGLWFYTKYQNNSPHDSKHYITAMKNFLDGLMAKSSLRFSLSHSYNQVDLDKHFNTGRVLLPLHSPLVFHYILNYNDTISNYYSIHFKFDNNHVTLSPCKLGTRKIHNYVNYSFDCSIDNVCKVILPKVLKVNQNGCFGYEDVMETIEDLVLTERKFLGESKLPGFDNEVFSYFQRDDRLYIYPSALDLSQTQFAHVNFEDKSEPPLVNDALELLGLKAEHNHQTSVTRFLQYNVNSQQEVHQQIFMEHISHVFREIFVIDPEVIKNHTWVEVLIHYSYLPEMGKIFTPFTENLAGYLVENSDDLSSANLQVEFLAKTKVNNYGNETDVLGCKIDLNCAFNHLQGQDFKFHKLSYFETWDCFKTSKGDIIKFNKSQNHSQNKGGNNTLVGNNSKETGSDGDNVTKTNQHKGNLANMDHKIPAIGAKQSLAENTEMAEKDGTKD